MIANNLKLPQLVYVRRYIVTGIVTVIPLWVTWLVFDFVLGQLSKFGRPWAKGLANSLQGIAPSVADLLLQPWFETLLAALLTLIGLYTLGWGVNRVVGKRIVTAFEDLIERLPFVQGVYGAVKKLLLVLQQKPEGVQRVVLIEFPSPGLRAVGFVTRTMTDPESGAKLAAVLIPTTPNPTTGFLEIAPLDRLISTDWTADEAMTFIVSGGAVSPPGKGVGISAQATTVADSVTSP